MTVADAGVRAFLALEIPPAVRRTLGELQRHLRCELGSARWVRPESVHLTVKFLGESSPAALDRLVAELTPRVAALGAVAVRLAGGGFFPDPRRPRVAWLGGDAEGIEPLVAAVEEVAADHGWAPERRRWALHLTLARLRRPWPPPEVERFLAACGEMAVPPFRCDALVLFRSTLGAGGARYDVLSEMPLR